MSNKESSQVITFGCRLNTFESEYIKNVLKHNNLHDIIVVNTCAVTAEAERQARQTIRRLKNAHPDKRIVVTGCAATIDRRTYENMPQVDCIITNDEKNNPQRFVAALSSQDATLSTKDAAHILPVYAPQFVPKFEGKSRAFLQIQTGCNNCCSFCIIRLARGKSVSYPLSQILAQARQLVDQGYQEINLTGVNITSFRSEHGGLGELLQLLLRTLPVRFRLSSLDPAELNDALYDAMHDERVLPHWHLSLQSGDSTVLARMLRRHTPDDIIRTSERVRAIRPEIALGADIIAGFPGETQDMFENSCRLVRQCEISLLHVFPYSERPNTVASTLPQKVSLQIRNERAKELRLVGHEVLHKVMQNLVGKIVDVFVEQKSGKGEWEGKTVHFFHITVRGDNIPIGQFIPVKIGGVLDNDRLLGVWSEQGRA
jgi:threonylcarbamoyladenosine tRNA methylthiotransferase MtaB